MGLKKRVSIKEFKYGVINSEEPQSIPRGAASNSLNWITKGAKIELRRGYALVGETENTGIGRITGLAVGKRPNGSDILYRTRKQKIEYFYTGLSDWVEAGTDALPAAVIADDALGEDISIEAYTNTTGQQVWLNSKNAGPYKFMTANPGSYSEMYVLGTNYKGRMRIKNGRQYVWDRAGNPPNNVDLFGSKLDVKGSASYTQIVDEVIAASGTLAFKGSGARRICFEVVATVGSETFTDNGDGTLTGSLGSEATINYTTGEYTGLGVGTATYRWADDSSGGIADFAFSGTRAAGEGFILKQAGGGPMQNLASLNGREYALHSSQTWVIDIPGDDVDITNLIYRAKVGIPNQRAMVETGDGIYYVDDTDENDPHLRILVLQSDSEQVVPRSISKRFKLNNIRVGVDLSGYRFDKAAAIEFGDFVLFACRTSDSETNNRVIMYNKVNGAIDILDYYVSQFALFEGTLVAGDSVSDNVYTLFTGLDDNEATINNFWEGSLDNLGYDGMKRVVELTIDGEVGPEQSGKLSLSIDRAPFTEVRSVSDEAADKHAIEGDGDYIDSSQSVAVGAFTLGRGEVGGGGDGINAYHYRRTFRIIVDKFEYIKFRMEATRIGYLSLTELTFDDVRVKWQRVPNRYRSGR